MEWNSLLVSVIAAIAIIVHNAQSEDSSNADGIHSLARLPSDPLHDMGNVDGSSVNNMIYLGELSTDDIEEILKRGSLLRFGKRGSLFRFGKRGSLLRFGKRGSLFRFGKRGDEDGYWSDGQNLIPFGKHEDTPFLDDAGDKRGSLLRFGKRAALFRYGRSADKGPHTPFRFGREEIEA